jgi:hypothetical protein
MALRFPSVYPRLSALFPSPNPERRASSPVIPAGSAGFDGVARLVPEGPGSFTEWFLVDSSLRRAVRFFFPPETRHDDTHTSFDSSMTIGSSGVSPPPRSVERNTLARLCFLAATLL